MRISGFLIGIVGFLVLIVSTGLCAFTAYTFTNDAVIGLWESGVQVESVNEVAQAIMNPEDFTAEDPVPTATAGAIVIPSITPNATAIPTLDTSNSGDETTVQATAVVADVTAVIEPTVEVDPTEFFAAERWSDPREINILLLGIDEREGFTNDNAYRTDTMMVLHIDPVRQTAAVISFPRDLYVDVPNYGQNRLNRANYIGDLNAYPNGGGPGLLMETINSNFGISIDYYVMINFTVFETVIDRIAPNGIEVCVEEYISDPTYPDAGFGTINVEFQVGCQQMDGVRLLQYARTRKTQGGDIDRNERQQQVIEATRQYVVSTSGVQGLLTQIGPLWTDLSGSYRTNMTLTEILSLARLMPEITDVTYESLGPGFWLPQQLENGDQVLLPVPSEIQSLIQETFYPGAELSIADYRALANQENVPIRVYNNTNIQGLAGNTSEYLTGLGVTVAAVSNMPTIENTSTRIQYYGSSRNTARYVAELLGLDASVIERANDGLAVNGIIVVAGTDMPTIISSGGD